LNELSVNYDIDQFPWHKDHLLDGLLADRGGAKPSNSSLWYNGSMLRPDHPASEPVTTAKSKKVIA